MWTREVSNGYPKGMDEEDDGGAFVGEPCPEPVGEPCDEPIAFAQVEIYFTLTPAPFAFTPVCRFPLPNPPHCWPDWVTDALYALRTHMSDR